MGEGVYYFFTSIPSNLDGVGLLGVRTKEPEVYRTDYHNYLNGDRWRAIKEAAIIRAGYKCLVCSVGPPLEVHHNTYYRVFGNELPEDLSVLCRDCHKGVHAGRITSIPNPLAKKPKKKKRRRRKKAKRSRR